jgi:tRNA G10  N-methylase Trm11
MSEKSEAVLRYFFGMTVDQYTTMLDPTCGSGSALRAADSLGAKRVLGLEIDEEFVDRARLKLRQARNLRELAG